MGLLTESAVPDWHPASRELKETCKRATSALHEASQAHIASSPQPSSCSSSPLNRTQPDLAQTALFSGLRSAAEWARHAATHDSMRDARPAQQHGFPTLVGMATCEHVHAAVHTMRVLLARTDARTTPAQTIREKQERRPGDQTSSANGAKGEVDPGNQTDCTMESRELIGQYEMLREAEDKVKGIVRNDGCMDWSWASG